MDGDKLRDYFNCLLQAVVTEINTEVQNKGYLSTDLGFTLLAFFAIPSWLAAMQIGDGLIVICSELDRTD